MSISGTVFIVSAPSGAGKTSLVAALLDSMDNICVSVSHTTREKREGEQEGINYHFVDHGTFEKLVKADEFLEHAKVFGNYYGTSRPALKEQLDQGKDVILEIDWQGADQVRRLFPDCISIFILPPSLETLRRRLTGRAQDAEDVIEARLKEAKGELEHYASADYLVVNDNFDQAVDELKAIITSARLGLKRQQERHATLIASLLS